MMTADIAATPVIICIIIEHLQMSKCLNASVSSGIFSQIFLSKPAANQSQSSYISGSRPDHCKKGRSLELSDTAKAGTGRVRVYLPVQSSHNFLIELNANSIAALQRYTDMV